MIRFLLWLIVGLPVGFVLVSLAVSSSDDAALRVWPLAYELRAPVGLVVLATLIVAFFVGMACAWLLGGRTRRRLRTQRRQIEDLRDEIAATHARLGQAMAGQQGGASQRALPPSKAA
ncbi:MAG: lipopolysaccharide assembly protein LapA domain-containing protein [Alphaproteobacteria bacterium]